MARDRDPSPLFEIISRSRKPAERGIPMPDWMRRKLEAERKPANESDQPASADPPDAAPRKPTPRGKKGGGQGTRDEKPAGPDARRREGRPTSAQDAEPEPGEGAAEPATVRSIGAPDDEEDGGGAMGAIRPLRVATVKGWLRRPIVLRLPRGTWMALGSAGVLLVLVGYMVGERVGEQRAEALATDYEQAAGSLEAARSQPARSDLIPPTVAGVESAAAQRSESGGGGGEASREVESAGGDPRRAGYNYFRLVSGGRDELERMSAFLAENGVDSTLVPTNNGYKLMALPGFTRPRSDPEAVQLHARLRELGRTWRSQHRGTSDWGDMFPERYVPGTN